MSTATERIMRERGDLTCFHEPFIYDYYINRKVRVIPHFTVEDNRPITYRQVRETLLKHAESSRVFIKDMSYYVMPHILGDSELGERLVNCFLIRDPVASIASYFKLDPDVICDEVGLEAQFRHYDALCASSRDRPVVIQAEDIRENAIKAIGALWEAIGLDSADHAFEWHDEPPEDWKQVEGWHEGTIASKRIKPITLEEAAAQNQNFFALSEKYPRMRDYLDHHRPYYEALKAQAIDPQ